MKKFIMFSLICILSGLVMIACQRDRGVYAANDGDYQPRPAPKVHDDASNKQVKGELLRVDVPRKMISVRVENGLEQTFKVDDNTVVLGLENQPAVRNLSGKEGSEVTVQWRDDNGVKMANSVDVTQIITAKNTRRSRHRR